MTRVCWNSSQFDFAGLEDLSFLSFQGLGVFWVLIYLFLLLLVKLILGILDSAALMWKDILDKQHPSFYIDFSSIKLFCSLKKEKINLHSMH